MTVICGQYLDLFYFKKNEKHNYTWKVVKVKDINVMIVKMYSFM